MSDTKQRYWQSRFEKRPVSEDIAVQDRLLLLIGNWFAIEAEGASAILAACFMTGYLGLLSTLVLIRRGTKFREETPNETSRNTYGIDQPK